MSTCIISNSVSLIISKLNTMTTSTNTTKVSLSNYTEMLDRRARLKAKIEDGTQFLNMFDRANAVREFRELTQQLNEVHKRIRVK